MTTTNDRYPEQPDPDELTAALGFLEDISAKFSPSLRFCSFDESLQMAEDLAWEAGLTVDPDDELWDELENEPGYEVMETFVIRAIQYHLMKQYLESQFTNLHKTFATALFAQIGKGE